jgi:hypothetical protein
MTAETLHEVRYGETEFWSRFRVFLIYVFVGPPLGAAILLAGFVVLGSVAALWQADALPLAMALSI